MPGLDWGQTLLKFRKQVLMVNRTRFTLGVQLDSVGEKTDLTATYKVRNIPTVLFIKGGEVVDKQVGAVPKASYKALIEKYI